MKTNLFAVIKNLDKKVLIKRTLIGVGALAGTVVLTKLLNNDECMEIDPDSFKEEEDGDIVDADIIEETEETEEEQ